MGREPLLSNFFALVIVQRKLPDQPTEFLLVQENKTGQPWYFPAGRVEPGERLQDAALREVHEEAGIRVRLEKILRIEFQPHRSGLIRQRIFFVASPIDEHPPKDWEDRHSIQAKWFPLDEVDPSTLRAEEVLHVLRAVSEGMESYPLSLLTGEGQSWSEE